MFLKNSFKISCLILATTCGNVLAMGADGAGPSSATPEVIVVRCCGLEFDLPIALAKRLPRFDQDFLQDALKTGVDIPLECVEVEVTQATFDLFKSIVAADDEEVTKLVQNASIEQLKALVYFFAFFVDHARAEQVVLVLADKMSQPEFLRAYLGELVTLPEPWRGEVRDILAKKLDVVSSVRTLAGHIGRIFSMVLMPDNRTLITGSNDRTIRVWDIETGECKKTLTGHTGAITCMQLMPDNRTLITGSSDDTIRVWDIETGECKKTLTGHASCINCMRLMPNNRTLITGSDDRTIRVWDIETGKCKKILTGHTGWINCMVLMPDNRTLITGSLDRTIRVWDIETGECKKTLTGHTDWIRCMQLMPDNRTLITGSNDRTIRVWDIEISKCKKTLTGHASCINCMLLTPDNRTLITGSLDGTIHLWDIETGECKKTLTGHTDWINCMLLMPDSPTLITGSMDETIRVWQLPVPGLEKLSLEQMLFVLKLEKKAVHGIRQMMHPGLQMFFNKLPEATQRALCPRMSTDE